MNIYLKKFEVMNHEELLNYSGGHTVHQGNGLYCTKEKCWVDWPQTVNTIITNSTMNLLTGGAARRHSGGIL